MTTIEFSFNVKRDSNVIQKSNLEKHIIADINIGSALAKKIIDSFNEYIKRKLKFGEKATTGGIGTWAVMIKPPRTGRNPQTVETIIIQAKRIVNFEADPYL